jgi:hypothetical protein
VAEWVKCTRLSDNAAIYVNLDAVNWLRRNEQDGFTVVSFGSHEKDNFIRVSEPPEEIFESAHAKRPKR